MSVLSVRPDRDLLTHLSSFVHDGVTVAEALFTGDRLNYPHRSTMEHELGYIEPYTLVHESRVIEGLGTRAEAAIRLLAREAGSNKWFPNDTDQTLELLWVSHGAWRGGVSLDRFVAAFVMIDYAMNERTFDEDIEASAEIIVRRLHVLGFPPTSEGLEELFDGAPPACVGLGLIEL